jgi:1,4-dihydroxy-2-naphthoate octaprenyltransferase
MAQPHAPTHYFPPGADEMSNSRVLPAGDTFVQKVLRDFRVVENGFASVARLRGEGRFTSAVFPALAQDRNVLVELIPVAEWERPTFLVRWAHAIRIAYLMFSIFPLLLVFCRALSTENLPSLSHALLLFSSLILIHLGCNLWGEYEDHLRGVDSPEHLSGSGVVQKLWIPAIHLRNAGAALFLSGCLLGIILFVDLPLAVVGGPLLWIGLLGALGAASYSGWPFHYKYFGFGEPIVFFLSGPVVTLGAALICTYDPKQLPWFFLASLPLSFLATLRLHGGNIQRVPVDTNAGVFTIARFMGFRWSKWAYGFLLLAPFITVVSLIALHMLSIECSIILAAFPLAFIALRILPSVTGPLDPKFHELRKLTVQLHFSFGLLYSLSFLFVLMR